MFGIKNIVPSLLLLICLGPLGCGGSGNSSGGENKEQDPKFIDPPSVQPESTKAPSPSVKDTVLRGTVVKGIVKNAIVDVFKIDGGTINDTAFISGITDAQGSYSFTLEDLDYGPVLIKVSAGDESGVASASIMVCDIKPGCGEEVSFGDEVTLTSDFSMAAIIPSITKRTVAIANVTTLTDLAVEQATNVYTLDAEGIGEANSHVAAMFGINGDIVSLAVADITDSDAIAPLDLEAKKYALVSAALLGVMQERVLPPPVEPVPDADTETETETETDTDTDTETDTETSTESEQAAVETETDVAEADESEADESETDTTDTEQPDSEVETTEEPEEERTLPTTIAGQLQDLRELFNGNEGYLANSPDDLYQPRVYDVIQKAMKIGQRIESAVPFSLAIEALAKFQLTLDADGDQVFDVNDFAPLDRARRFDSDKDGVANLDDTFPNNPAEWVDTDGDGFGDNGDDLPEDKRYHIDTDGDGWANKIDAFPNNRLEWKDSDGDNVGNNRDAFPYYKDEWIDTDGDGWGDNLDLFPNDPKDYKDSDRDGVGDNADIWPYWYRECCDADGDGRGDRFGDAFPNDPTEWADSDMDRVGDNADAFPYNRFESKDSDGDGFGDNQDDFPYDPERVIDSDGDGYANREDAFPYTAREWFDSDGDGRGDNVADRFPDDPTEWADWDRDGIGDNSDPCPTRKGDWCTISQKPKAISQAVDVIQGTTIAITMEATDADSESLTLRVSTEPELGSLISTSENDPVQIYSTSKIGGCDYSETFEFVASDGDSISAPGIITVNVVCLLDLALGDKHSCALVDPVVGEALLCWGDDSLAQTAASEQIDSTVSSLFAGDNHSCALTQSGTYCWGDDTEGQAGDHAYTELLSMSAGSKHSCVLDTNAVIECWGNSAYEPLQTTPELSSVTALTSAGDFNCALYSAGESASAVNCWGANDYGQQSVPELNNPTMIAAGSSHICAIDADGVSCWGGFETSLITTPTGIGNPTAIAVGNDFSCVIDDAPEVSSEASADEVASGEEAPVEQASASTVVCWGIADSEVVNNVPVVNNPTMLKAGGSFVCVIDDSGLKCWGSNDRGQLAPPS